MLSHSFCPPDPPPVEAQDAVERRRRQERRRHLHPDLIGVEEERRREGRDRPGRQRLAGMLREIAPGEPQRHPGQDRREHRHRGERPHLAAQPVGRHQRQGQHLVVPRVLLAVRPHRISRLRLDGPVHEEAPVLRRVVVRQVGVEVVGQAVGDQQIVGLVAVRLPVPGRPGEDGQVDRERQQEEQHGRPSRQPLAQERPERHRLPRHPAAQHEQQARGEHLLVPQTQVGPGQHQQHQQGESPQLRRRPLARQRPAAHPHAPAVDSPQASQDQGKEDERAPKGVAWREGQRSRQRQREEGKRQNLGYGPDPLPRDSPPPFRHLRTSS